MKVTTCFKLAESHFPLPMGTILTHTMDMVMTQMAQMGKVILTPYYSMTTAAVGWTIRRRVMMNQALSSKHRTMMVNRLHSSTSPIITRICPQINDT